MPLIRKILLVLFVILILILFVNIFITELIIPYRETQKQIEKLEAEWDGSSNTDDMEDLLERSKQLSHKFYRIDDFSLESFAESIKDILVESSVTINQFRTEDSSITFLFQGTRAALLNALWALSERTPQYHFDSLQLKVDKDRELQGTLTLSPLFYPEESHGGHHTDEIKQSSYTSTYNKSLAEIWGEPVVRKFQEEERDTAMEVTDKFSYIGIIRGEGGIKVMFRESTNGRVFIYNLGKTISDWKLEEIKDSSYTFRHQDRLYEVKK